MVKYRLYHKLMEVHAKDQSMDPPSKVRAVGKSGSSGQSIGTIDILPSQEPYISTSHVYKYFPRGQQIKSSPRSRVSSRTSSRHCNSSLVLIQPRLPLYTERTMNIYMPRLTFNHSADIILKSRRSIPCPSVTNNKTCMKKKGLNVNDLYSFKQRHRSTNSGETFRGSCNLKIKRNNTDQGNLF